MSSTLELSRATFESIKQTLIEFDIDTGHWNIGDEDVVVNVGSIGVYDALKLKHILEQGQIDHSVIKVELFILGGGMRGFASATFVSLVNYLGWEMHFSGIWASSAGVHSATYLADGAMSAKKGKTFDGACIYPKELASKGFIRFRRIFSGDFVNTRLLEDIFRRGERSLDVQNVRKYPIPIHISVTDSETLEGEIIWLNDPKYEDHVIDWSIASSSIPGVTPPKQVCGRSWMDGDLNSIFKLFLWKKSSWEFTHVLVLPNTSQIAGGNICKGDGFFISCLSRLIFRITGPHQSSLKQKCKERSALANLYWNVFRDMCTSAGIPIEVLWSPPNDVGSISRSEVKLWKLGKGMEAEFEKHFGVKSSIPWNK